MDNQTEQKPQNPESANQQHVSHEQKRPHRSITWPVVLICIGIVWLLHTLGISLNWSVIFPIFLIVLGVFYMFNRRLFDGAFIALIIVVLIAAFVVSLFSGDWSDISGLDLHLFDAKKIDTTTKDITVATADYPDIKNIDLEVSIGSGSYTLTSIPDAENIFSSVGTYNYEHLAPALDVTTSGDTLELRYATEGSQASLFATNAIADYELNIGNQNVTADLDLSIGSGNAEVNLNSQALKNVGMDIGSGIMSVDFTGSQGVASMISFSVGSGTLEMRGLANSNFTQLDGEFGSGTVELAFDGTFQQATSAVRIEGGSGNVQIEVPKEVGFSVTSITGSGEVSVDGEEYNDDFESDNFDDAAHTLTFDIELGSGDVTFVTK